MKDMQLQDWYKTIEKLEERFGGGLDLQAILFLVGLQELGQSYQTLNKNQKVDVMHVAACALLSQWGYYEFVGHDEDGWPHWKETEKLPNLNAKQQDLLIKEAIVQYFS
tara:strand:- start:369 stop:695 length:327 start_codon:yes stop_codon:yes gene_type:complete